MEFDKKAEFTLFRLAKTPQADNNAFMSEEPANRPEDDSFAPPDIPVECRCLECGAEFDSYQLIYREKTTSKGKQGYWTCPTQGCTGHGFGHDILPLEAFEDMDDDSDFPDDSEQDAPDEVTDDDLQAIEQAFDEMDDEEDEADLVDLIVEFEDGQPPVQVRWHSRRLLPTGADWFGLIPGQFVIDLSSGKALPVIDADQVMEADEHQHPAGNVAGMDMDEDDLPF